MSPDHVLSIDMHGTGTALGDPIEVGAIAAVLQVRRNFIMQSKRKEREEMGVMRNFHACRATLALLPTHYVLQNRAWDTARRVPGCLACSTPPRSWRSRHQVALRTSALPTTMLAARWRGLGHQHSCHAKQRQGRTPGGLPNKAAWAAPGLARSLSRQVHMEVCQTFRLELRPRLLLDKRPQDIAIFICKLAPATSGCREQMRT